MRLIHLIGFLLVKLFYLVAAVLLLFSPIGTLEFYNHLKGGDALRPWVLTDQELSRLKIKELDLQSCEQDYARARMLDALDNPKVKENKNGKETNEAEKRR